MEMYFSIIIPVYNRPDEIKELLDSLLQSSYEKDFEVVIVEDGSGIDCKRVVEEYSNKLTISYYFKQNSGPGDSRNYGMRRAKGDYFIIFDSDCIIPSQYLVEVEKELQSNYVDCFGGSDNALKSFSNIQKAINFAMTSFLTTGGIRGGSEKINKFQPRSFNMGISKKAFEKSNGFGNIHPGEDPDLTIRLWKLGFETRLFSSAFVYHKRRIDWDKFSVQVSKFGKARPILNSWYPEYNKITYWFPAFFIIGLLLSVGLLLILFDWFLKFYFLYFIVVFIVSSFQNKNPIIGLLSVIAVWKQFFGYGFGYLTSFVKINILKQKPQDAFPELFFKVKTSEEPIEKQLPIEKEIPIQKSVEKAIDAIIAPIQKLVEPIERKTRIVGLTGGIGSGKTTIANYMQSKGIPVYISDLEAKKVMDSPEIVQKITEIFGADVIDASNKLIREKLASIVFNESEKLKLLNGIVHPAVKKHFENWILQYQKAPFVIKEAAILFESGSYKDCDYIITITSPLETRINRVLQRDSTTKEKVLQRINNQLSDEERKARSEFVIENNDFEATKIQVDQILEILKNK